MNRNRAWIGILLMVGLFGHLVAAHLSGGSSIAYQHHILGFFLILALTGVVTLALARFFWRGKRDTTLLTIAAVQAVVGILIAFSEYTHT
jgi:hypothetical protein